MSDRKVHFSEPIHQIEYLDKQWETASRLARDGSGWLRMGLDRQRFKDRVERIGEILEKILNSNHRLQIYRDRFENFQILPEQEYRESNKNRNPSVAAAAATALANKFDIKHQTTKTKQQSITINDDNIICKEDKREPQHQIVVVKVVTTNRKIKGNNKKNRRRKKIRHYYRNGHRRFRKIK